MKKFLKTALLLLLVFAMAFSVMACSGDEDEQGGEVTNVIFPLEQPVTFKLMLAANESIDFRDQVKNNSVYKKLVDETNVHLDFQFLGDAPGEKLALLMTSKDYGDVMYGSTILTSGEASKYIAAGLFKDLTKYIKNTELMPELAKDMAEDPEVLNMITAADGKIYTLPKITGLEGHYLESPIWINKAWLNKVGKGIPTTADELYDVLKAFKTGDPNGNDIADEIPYIASTSHSYMHCEALLGMFGIATKDGTNDAFVQVVDGKVTFAPAQKGYKDAINYLAKLYKEDLMWKEVFTSNSTTMTAKLTSPTCVVGMFTTNVPVETDYVDEYVCIAPPKAEGYETCWYMHPAIHGSKNQFYVMNTCKNLEVLMKWCDKFYDLETAITAENGTVDEGRITLTAEGKYAFAELDTITASKLEEDCPTLMSLLGTGVPRSITSSDYAEKIDWGYVEKTKQHVYGIYKDYITSEPWPRPYYAAEDSYDAAEYTTDMFNQVQQNRAKWITSGGVTDAEFDAHLKTLEKMGLKRFLEILQKAYDAYKSGSNVA